jgi:hypothetical protein
MRSSTPSTSRAINWNTILANSNFRVLALERQITDTTEYDEVRALNPFLSKQTVTRIQPMLTYMTDKLCNRIEEFRTSGQQMPIHLVYSCLTTDTVTLIALNHNRHLLDSPDFSPA